jgi:hypothetical protein
MRRRRVPHVASVTFCLVLALAVVALSWGATHTNSSSHGLGTPAQQAAARNTLATGLVLPSGLARDETFTACGTTGAACLTSTADVAQTLASLATVLEAAGGSIGSTCTVGPVASAPAGVVTPTFSCAVEGRLDGAWLLVLLGSGWQLPPSPSQPAPRTAVLVGVETASAHAPYLTHTTLPDALPNAGPLLPANWVSAVQPCTPATPVLVPATSQTATPATATPTPAVSPGPILPTCTPHMATIEVAAPVAVLDAGRAFAATALAAGFRLDGRPCVADPALKGCGVWGERMAASGVQTLLVATLQDSGHGYMTGTVSLTDLS